MGYRYTSPSFHRKTSAQHYHQRKHHEESRQPTTTVKMWKGRIVQCDCAHGLHSFFERLFDRTFIPHSTDKTQEKFEQMFEFQVNFLYPQTMAKTSKSADVITELPDGPADEHGLTTRQLKILQEAITLSIFVPFAVLYMEQPLKLDYLWAGLCILGAVYFIFRS